MKKCYRCDTLLTEENSSDEHVIINACGGRLKSKRLLCQTCNSIFGDSFDNELAKITNDLSNLLLIKRHRGNPQPIKGKASKTGEEYFLEFGGNPKKVKPVINEKVDGKNVELTISADNEKQFKEILKGLKRKYPELDIDAISESATRGKGYLDDTIHFQTQVGGKEVFKAITKTAINYFILNGGDSVYIKHLLPYLENKIDLDVVWMHYPKEYPYQYEEDEVTHILRLVGDSKERILYCYVELFNVQNYIVKLNENYCGPDMSCQYVFDILQLKEIQKDLTEQFTRDTLLDLFINKDGKPFEVVQKRYSRVLRIADSRQISKHQSELISNGVNNSLGKKGDGELITKEMIDETVNEIMKEMTPFLLHRLNMNNKNDK
nr:HNH endonuclease [uncultured Draconibacterium sp.]